MAWTDTITSLDAIKASLTTAKGDTLEEVEKTSAVDLQAVIDKTRELETLVQEIRLKAEQERAPTEQEVLKAKLNEIRADKEHTEKEERDKFGFITMVTFDSEKAASTIIQEWLYSDTTINRRGAGTTLKEVAK